jgi:hypothetical protein
MDMSTKKSGLHIEATSHHHHHHPHHRRKTRWASTLLAQFVSSFVAPLMVGLTLQGFKGCDGPSGLLPALIRPPLHADAVRDDTRRRDAGRSLCRQDENPLQHRRDQ